MRSCFAFVLLLLASLVYAGPVGIFRAGLNADFNLQSGTYTSALGSGSIDPTGPTLVTKPAGSLDITLDVGSFFGSTQSIPITMHGTELAATRMQWTVDQSMNVTVTVNGVRITVQHVTGVLTADAAFIAPTHDPVADEFYDVRFAGATGNAGNNFRVTGVLPDLFNAPFSATAQDLVYFGFGGINRFEPILGPHIG
ncbi:MAG TPA: hypothetical protein VG820_06010 [Fimbriimonadaceae bacterium]|nr:hypothetical protein [Fimbriimonadaceae bacterium]